MSWISLGTVHGVRRLLVDVRRAPDGCGIGDGIRTVLCPRCGHVAAVTREQPDLFVHSYVIEQVATPIEVCEPE